MAQSMSDLSDLAEQYGVELRSSYVDGKVFADNISGFGGGFLDAAKERGYYVHHLIDRDHVGLMEIDRESPVSADE